MPVGFGRLSNDNLRWGGIIDASTGLVAGVTSSGTNAGLKIGEALPTATDNLGGLYVVASVGGDQITVTPGVTYDAGDWCLCINKAEGWVRIDTLSSGGGGGGGASTLGELLDVTLTAEAEGEFLQLQATGQWSNIEVTPDTIGALKPGDNVSELVNDAGYLTSATLPPGADLWDVDSGAIYPSTTTNDVHIGGTLPGTPNISLNASDGSATFKGDYILVGSNPGNSADNTSGITAGVPGIVINKDSTKSDSDYALVVTKHSGSGTTYAETARINNNGSATFAGTVDTGVARGIDGTGASLEDYGGVRAARPSTQVNPNTANVWEGWLGTDITSAIKADGSAEFAGRGTFGSTITCGSTDYSGPYTYLAATEIALNLNSSTSLFKVQSDGTVLIGGTLPSAPNISLNASDGSASLAGSLALGVATGDVANRNGWLIGNTGYAAAWNKADGIYTWYGQKDSSNLVAFAASTGTNISAAKAVIMADGRVGSGISNPLFNIDSSTISQNGGTTTAARFACSDSNSVFVRLSNNANQLGYLGYESDKLTFFTDNNFRAAIDGDGKLLVGTTYAIGSSNLQTKQNSGDYDKGLDLINDQDYGYGSAINWYARAQEPGAPLVLTAQMRTQWEGRNAYSINFKCLRDDDVYERMIIGSRGDVKFIGNGTSEAPNISLNADGTIIAKNAASRHELGRKTDVATNSVLKVSSQNNDGTNDKDRFIIDKAGNVFIGDLTEVGNASPTGANISLNADGTIQAGGDANAGVAGTKIFSEGAICVCRNGTDVAFNTKAEGSTTTTSQILADGSATFAGDVICGGYVPGNVNTYGIRLNASANQVAIRTATSSTDTAFKITAGGSDSAVITTAGSATFTGKVTAQSFDLEALNPCHDDC